MRINLILLVVLLMNFHFFQAQEIEKIKIKKENSFLFQGESQEIQDWYIFIDLDSIWYLANLTIPENEVKDWFDKRKNSQNIFKGEASIMEFKTINFTKENDFETNLDFYINLSEDKMKLILTSIQDGRVYRFYKK